MKRFFFFLVVLLIGYGTSFASYEVSNGSVVFTSIIEGTGSVDEARANLETFFALRYNDANSAAQLVQADRLIYKGLFLELGSFAMGMWTIDAPHVVEVSIKDGRVRVRISVSEAVYRSTGASMVRYSYVIPSSPPFADRCSNKAVSKKDCALAFAEIERRCELLLSDVAAFLVGGSSDDDW